MAWDAEPLLLVRGLGGPDAALLARSLAPVSTVTLYGRVPNDEERFARESGLLKQIGPIVEIPFHVDAAKAARAVAEYGVGGVVTFSEVGLALAAGIAERLGLEHHHSVETANLLRNKPMQRLRLKQHGIPTPKVAPFTERTAAKAASTVGFPAVLKPVRGSGSGHTYRVDSMDEALIQYLHATELLRADRSAAAPSAQFVLESYLPDGTPPEPRLANYLSVESATINGQTHHLGISDRLPLAPPFRETGAVAPSILDEPLRGRLLELTSEALQALGVATGITHTEIKLTPDGPRIIEVNGRAGGPIPEMYAVASDLDIVRLGAHIAVGSAEPPVAVRFLRHVAFWVAHAPAEELELLSLGGLHEITALPGVVSVKSCVHPPTRVNWRVAGPGGSALAYVVVVADSRDELHQVLDDAQRLLRAAYRRIY